MHQEKPQSHALDQYTSPFTPSGDTAGSRYNGRHVVSRRSRSLYYEDAEGSDLMDSISVATPLDIHTLDTLCAELVSGRGVAVDNGNIVQLHTKASRAIFDWYLHHRDKWTGKNMKVDAEAIADQIDRVPPELDSFQIPTTSDGPRIVHLKSVRAHRFAGIHRYGGPDAPPADFEFDIEAPLSIIEGNNGAGKTSLLSAISWCLTGHIYRSHRPPESAENPIEIWTSESDATTEDTDHTVALPTVSSITPLPPANVMRALGGSPPPVDTWVELTFVDDDDNEVGPIRRSLRRATRGGAITVISPDLSCLSVPPIALEIGTLMTGLLPYIRLGDKSELGTAVAELTGLRPLKDLVSDARKSQQKLRGVLPKDREKEIAKLDGEFFAERQQLDDLLTKHVEIAPHLSPPQPSSADCEEDLRTLKAHFGEEQANALANAQEILSETFDAADDDMRKDLLNNSKPAIAAVSLDAIGKLPSAKRLHSLAQLSEEDLDAADSLVNGIKKQAEELTSLLCNPARAARLRLYAKVAGWLKERGEDLDFSEKCPVCEGDLRKKEDSVTGKPILDHIQECVDSECEHLEYTIEKWAESAHHSLSGELSDTLSGELRKGLPGTPGDLIKSALADELFESACFSNALKPLKSITRNLCEAHLSALPTFEEPPECVFSAAVESATKALALSVNRLNRAIAFSRWRKANREACQKAFRAIVGREITTAEPPDAEELELEECPLVPRLAALDRLVTDSEPLGIALERVNKMAAKVTLRREKEKKISQYSKAATAIEELLSLDALVDRQVETLMTTLATETARWKASLYSPAYTDAPRTSQPDVQEGGKLVIDAETEGTRTAAQHICNSSDLRATLLAFLFAFWKNLLSEKGGLSLLLFDDLQELFDPLNRRRVANTISEVAAERSTIILTTNDHEFARKVRDSATTGSDASRVDHRQLLPAKAVGLRMTLSKCIDAIHRKREEFEKSTTEDDEVARDYLNELRVYIEARLLGFFDVPDPNISTIPTLSDLVNAIRRRVNAGHEGFSSLVFSTMVSAPALADRGEVVRLMNESHHGNAHLITNNDVSKVGADLKHVLKLVHSAHEEYERWLRRDPPEITPAKPVVAVQGRSFSFSVPQINVLAASTAGSPLWEVAEADEPFSCDWLANHAIYINTTDNFGFSGCQNCRVIVDLENDNPVDASLVIAIYRDKVYARRLLRPDGNLTQVVLAAETSNPINRPPGLLLPAAEVRLFPVVGVLFDNSPVYPRPSGEAKIDQACRILDDDVKIAFAVRGESALPLVIEGQTILGGLEVRPADMLSMEEKVVALSTSDGCAFKRVGRTLADATHVRQFESVGGLGESILARTEEVEDDRFDTMPLVESAREILGVLYPPEA